MRYGQFRAETLFNKFLDEMPRGEFNNPSQKLVGFVAWLSLQGYRSSTMKTYVSILRKGLRVSNPSLDSSEVNSKVKGAFCLERGMGRTKQLVTISMLRNLVGQLGNLAANAYEGVMYKSMVMLMYFGLLRVGEVTQTDHVLKFRNVKISYSPRRVVLRFETAKNDRTGEIRHSATVYPDPDERVCPVLHLLNYFLVRPQVRHNEENLYVKFNSHPVTEYEFRVILTKACKLMHWSRRVTSHSFRMGRATQLFLSGVPLQQIQQAGWWCSNAVLSYIQPF